MCRVSKAFRRLNHIVWRKKPTLSTPRTSLSFFTQKTFSFVLHNVRRIESVSSYKYLYKYSQFEKTILDTIFRLSQNKSSIVDKQQKYSNRIYEVDLSTQKQNPRKITIKQSHIFALRHQLMLVIIKIVANDNSQQSSVGVNQIIKRLSQSFTTRIFLVVKT